MKTLKIFSLVIFSLSLILFVYTLYVGKSTPGAGPLGLVAPAILLAAVMAVSLLIFVSSVIIGKIHFTKIGSIPKLIIILIVLVALVFVGLRMKYIMTPVVVELQCPQAKIVSRVPGSEGRISQYYIIDEKKVDISAFPNGWVEANCNIRTEETQDEEIIRRQAESTVINNLLNSWKQVQANFAVKAGESGTYNTPDKIQFISGDTMLVHYDDGLVDHISVVQSKNGSFTELKNVGVMSTMSQSQWQLLVNTYGDTKYPYSNYQSMDYKNFDKVSTNIFVR